MKLRLILAAILMAYLGSDLSALANESRAHFDLVFFSDYACRIKKNELSKDDRLDWSCFAPMGAGKTKKLPLKMKLNPGDHNPTLARVGPPHKTNWLCYFFDRLGLDTTGHSAEVSDVLCQNPFSEKQARLEASFRNPDKRDEEIDQWMQNKFGKDYTQVSGVNAELEDRTPYIKMNDGFSWMPTNDYFNKSARIGSFFCGLDNFEIVRCFALDAEQRQSGPLFAMSDIGEDLSPELLHAYLWQKEGLLSDLSPNAEWRGLYNFCRTRDCWALELDPKHPRGIAFRERYKNEIIEYSRTIVTLNESFLTSEAQSKAEGRINSGGGEEALLRQSPAIWHLYLMAQSFALIPRTLSESPSQRSAKGAPLSRDELTAQVALELAVLHAAGISPQKFNPLYIQLVKKLELSLEKNNLMLIMNSRLENPVALVLKSELEGHPTFNRDQLEEFQRRLRIVLADFASLAPDERSQITKDTASLYSDFQSSLELWAKDNKFGRLFAFISDWLKPQNSQVGL